MEKYRIGRHPGNDIVLDFPQVSGTHAELTVLSSSSLLIKDLGSAHGTFINQLRVKRCVLKPGDEVKIANITLDLSPYFRLPDSEEPDDVSSPNDYTKAFAKLEKIYYYYEKIKRIIRRKWIWEIWKKKHREGIFLTHSVCTEWYWHSNLRKHKQRRKTASARCRV
ncbi:MAG: FHA domain-containing protein [Cytophagales bacterium]|nr:FHA domain-containing protein [Cytophagales bacterium]